MPALAPITIGDGTVDKVFKPRDSVGGLSTLIVSNGVPIGDLRLTIQNSRTPTGKSKVAVNFVLPVVQDMVVAGVSRSTVVRTAYAKTEFTFDATSTAAERRAARLMISNLLAGDLTTASMTIDDLNPIY